MKLITAGESHGKALIGILEGLPSGMTVDTDETDRYLALRGSGYGRGGRQKIERDRIVILSGVRDRKTLGSPLSFMIENRDYENWKEYMAPEGCDTSKKRVENVRPGHADLAGLMKYGGSDARNILERASARETAVRVAGGTIAREYLTPLGIEISGRVVSVGDISDENAYSFEDMRRAKDKALFMLDDAAEKAAEESVDRARSDGDTLGGIIEIRVRGLKSGFGSCMYSGKKLDAMLASAVIGVQAMKGIEFGMGFAAAGKPGSRVHDEIFYEDGKFARHTNNAGGIEGGMSNGGEIVFRAAMKPIPTLMKGLSTVNYVTKEKAVSAGERSDVCAICAAEIVLESVTALTIADAVSDRLGGDRYEEVVARYAALP